MKKAWGPYADEMERNFRPFQQKEIPPGLSKDELLEYWGVHQYPQDDPEEHMGDKAYEEFERYWDKYKNKPEETEELSMLPPLPPWTGTDTQDSTETNEWL